MMCGSGTRQPAHVRGIMLAKDEPAFKLMGASVCELFGYLTGYDWGDSLKSEPQE